MTGPDVQTQERADAHDWAWRRRIRANPALHAAYRVLVFVAGLAVVVLGIALVPLPGPGWVIVFLGLAIWGSEFRTAQRLLGFVRGKVRGWTAWTAEQSLWVKALVGLGTLALLLGVAWVMLRMSGVPAFLPDRLQTWLNAGLGLG